MSTQPNQSLTPEQRNTNDELNRRLEAAKTCTHQKTTPVRQRFVCDNCGLSLPNQPQDTEKNLGNPTSQGDELDNPLHMAIKQLFLDGIAWGRSNPYGTPIPEPSEVDGIRKVRELLPTPATGGEGEPISPEKYWDLCWPDESNEIRDGGSLPYGDDQRRQRFNNYIESYAQARADEAYQRGRIDEAKTCEAAKRHDAKRLSK